MKSDGIITKIKKVIMDNQLTEFYTNHKYIKNMKNYELQYLCLKSFFNNISHIVIISNFFILI